MFLLDLIHFFHFLALRINRKMPSTEHYTERIHSSIIFQRKGRNIHVELP